MANLTDYPLGQPWARPWGPSRSRSRSHGDGGSGGRSPGTNTWSWILENSSNLLSVLRVLQAQGRACARAWRSEFICVSLRVTAEERGSARI